VLHAGDRAARPLAVRLAHAEAQARLKRINVVPELRLARLAMQSGRSAAHVERRLEVVERRVFPQRP
jgi:hypothetical protein